MKRIFTAASLVALLSATSAGAADLGAGPSVDNGYDAPSRNAWTGLWVAIEGGGLFANDTLNADWGEAYDGGSAFAGLEVDGLGSSGFYGDIGIGFDYLVTDRIFIGLKGNLNADTAEWKASAGMGGSDGENSGSFSGEVVSSRAWGGQIGPRIGFLLTQKTAFFVGGGLAYAEFNKAEWSTKDVVNGETVASDGGNVFADQETEAWGWYGEAGLESHLQNGWFLRASGVYVDYEDLELYVGENHKITDDRSELIAKAGIVYKFGIGN